MAAYTTSTKLTLNNGKEIPVIGFGTWQIPPELATSSVKNALIAGYRHIDCAWGYMNETEVGIGIKEFMKEYNVSRSEIFVTTKVWGTFHRRRSPEETGTEYPLGIAEGFQDSLNKLGLDYVDLLLVHWPLPLTPYYPGKPWSGNHKQFPLRPDGSRFLDYNENGESKAPLTDTWKQMEELLKDGAKDAPVKAIGVSNFSKIKLEEILATAKVIPAVNQLELHPYNPQHNLVKYMKEKGIVAQAYSPLGSGKTDLFTNDVVKSIAEKHGLGEKTAPILLGYPLKKGQVVIAKSTTESRIRENASVAQLDDEDIAKLNALAASGKQKRIGTPPWGTVLGFEDWWKAALQGPDGKPVPGTEIMTPPAGAFV